MTTLPFLHYALGITAVRGLLISLLALTLLFAVAAMMPASLSRTLDRVMRGFARFLLGRGLFRTSLAAEAKKTDLLRIATGVILLVRTSWSALFILGQAPLFMQAVCIGELLVAAAFLLGFATPLASLLLLFFNIFFVDYALSTYTLGSDVLAMLLLIFAFAPAGTAISLDAFVMRRGLPGAGVLRTIYAWVGPPTKLRFILVKWMALLSYGLLCLFSVLMHTHEPTWLGGSEAVYLLVSSYTSHYYGFFQSLLPESKAAVEFARLSMLGMIAWYFCFLPFILIGGWLRRLVLVWTVLFFLFSLFVLQLSWLAYYEFILLAALFWNRAFMGRRGGFEILYDDGCNLCDRTIRVLRAADIFGVLKYRPLSQSGALIAELSLTQDAVFKDLYGFDRARGRLWRGYDFYLELSRRLLLLVWLYPLGLLGRYTIGPLVYRIVAERRIRWFGVCKIPADYNKSPYPPQIDIPKRTWPISRAWFAAFFCIHSALATLFILTLPYSPLRLPNIVSHVEHVYGLAPINVFNRQDLIVSTHWITLDAVRADGSMVRAPLAADDGGRMAWQKSDPVYFASTGWRRSKFQERPVCYGPDDGDYLQRHMVWFAHRFQGGGRGWLPGDLFLSAAAGDKRCQALFAIFRAGQSLYGVV